MSQNGEGDLERPTNREAYEQNYEQIDWGNWPERKDDRAGERATAKRENKR